MGTETKSADAAVETNNKCQMNSIDFH